MRYRRVEPAEELRYLRHRGNRRVRKARALREALRSSRAVALHLLLAVACLGALWIGAGRLRASEEFRFDRIEIEGAVRADRESIRARLQPVVGRSLLDVDLAALAATLCAEPWVREVSLRREIPDTLRVRIVERTPVAMSIIDGSASLVDSTGVVIGAAGPGRDDGLPVLTGFDGLDGALLAERLRAGVAMLERLRAAAAPLLDSVSELDLSEPDRVALRLVSGGPPILLDPERVERNLGAWLRLREEIDRVAGPALYIDLRWQDRISVLPASSRHGEGNG